MFTGIVQMLGTIASIEGTSDGARLRVNTAELARASIGASVCVSGVCLTIVERDASGAAFDLASETIRKTTFGQKEIGDAVNLECSLQVQDSVDGHFVFGHVDAVAEVRQMQQEGETWKFTFVLPKELRAMVAPKGSVSLDGVSLTVGEVTTDTFSVYIIPHTLAETTLQYLSPGKRVNLEVDMLARYVARAMEVYRND